MRELAFHRLADLFPLMEGEELAALQADIVKNGLREPIVLYEGEILDGRNRYRAAPSQARFTEYQGSDPLGFVISANLHRRHLNESQRAMIADSLATMRQGQRTDIAQICAMSQTEAAERLQVSRRVVQSARTVRSQGTPELIAAVEQGKVSVSAAASASRLPAKQQLAALAKGEMAVRTAAKKAARDEKEATLAAKVVALPTEQYVIAVIDSAWREEPWSRETGLSKAPDNHYPTQTIDEIINLPPPLAPDAIGYMFSTTSMLRLAIDVLEAWGLTYKSCMVWVKERRGKRSGTGRWSRVDHELVLIATKGKPPAPAESDRISSVLYAPVGRHSEKPDALFRMIENQYPNVPKLEMYARKQRPGWRVWGMEAPNEK